jgi:hypothetical protein
VDVIAVVSVNAGATAGAAICVGLGVTITGGLDGDKKRRRRTNRAPTPGLRSGVPLPPGRRQNGEYE